jgi:hypothetical protein
MKNEHFLNKRFDRYEKEPPTEVWGKIEQHLIQKKRRKKRAFVFFLTLSGGLSIVVFSILFNNEKKQHGTNTMTKMINSNDQHKAVNKPLNTKEVLDFMPKKSVDTKRLAHRTESANWKTSNEEINTVVPPHSTSRNSENTSDAAKMVDSPIAELPKLPFRSISPSVITTASIQPCKPSTVQIQKSPTRFYIGGQFSVFSGETKNSDIINTNDLTSNYLSETQFSPNTRFYAISSEVLFTIQRNNLSLTSGVGITQYRAYPNQTNWLNKRTSLKIPVYISYQNKSWFAGIGQWTDFSLHPKGTKPGMHAQLYTGLTFTIHQNWKVHAQADVHLPVNTQHTLFQRPAFGCSVGIKRHIFKNHQNH